MAKINIREMEEIKIFCISLDRRAHRGVLQLGLIHCQAVWLQMHFCCSQKVSRTDTFLILGINISCKLQQSHDNLTISAEGSMMQRNEPDEIVQNKCKR